ncbi:hypothetical protein RFI_09264 [Reticulomyxa filosa]|uniref:BAR domain-containing protein n=1 Tax=Reticulomyxa filosa TaxID=46433 RepID=X6NPQ1_RETFI|nr:hypothetical protein RFI_09264 [Reticulomyxa filosa]|eukprot:ETO27868.1 hypothetical protein RFI_09264 [Reticulomyxa filosa]
MLFYCNVFKELRILLFMTGAKNFLQKRFETIKEGAFLKKFLHHTFWRYITKRRREDGKKIEKIQKGVEATSELPEVAQAFGVLFLFCRFFLFVFFFLQIVNILQFFIRNIHLYLRIHKKLAHNTQIVKNVCKEIFCKVECIKTKFKIKLRYSKQLRHKLLRWLRLVEACMKQEQYIFVLLCCRGLTEFARQNLTFSEATRQMKVEAHDYLSVFSKQLGKVMQEIDVCNLYIILFFNIYLFLSEQEYLNQLVTHLVIPLEQFRDVDIEQLGKLKWKYVNVKADYDVAANNIAKASKDSLEKVQELQHKKESKQLELDKSRDEFINGVKDMENKKNTELMASLQRYYGALVGYSKQVVSVMAENPVNFKEVNKDLISNLHASNPPVDVKEDI